VQAERIKENEDYEGIRLTLTAFLDKAQIRAAPSAVDI
jgi:hypothetical protein